MTTEQAATKQDGAIVGLAVGSIAAILGIATSQWWLIAAAPAGAASGITAARWIRGNRPIPIRAVFVPTLVATVVGAYVVVTAMTIGSALQSGSSVDVIPTILGFGAVALGFAGIPAFIAITPFAWAAAILLRRRLAAGGVS